jgi:putative pyruvate formate lyase activating enzyme
MGRAVDAEEFARICLALRDRGAENINIVTGSHAVPALALGIDAARAARLGIPVLWNSSAYESPGALEILRDRIDGYMPDLKTLDRAVAARFFHAPAYPDHAAAVIRRMLEYRPGQVIIRHLILPGYLDATREVLRWFAENARGKARLSLMSQYTPVRGNNSGGDMPERPVEPGEYETVLRWLEEFDIDEGFYQELVTGSDWLPDFSRQNPFPSELSLPVWHWSGGFL